MNENWTSKNPPPELSDSDAELLSAYLDNMLEPQERAALEARLQSDAFLRSELAAMRQMLGWLKTMPTLKAPRNFTISEADVKQAAPKLKVLPRRNNWQIASAAAAFVVLLGLVIFLTQLNMAPKAENQNVALRSTEEERLQETGALYATTGTPEFLPMPTLGVPQGETGNGVPADGRQEQEEAAEESELGRSADSNFGGDGEMDAPPQSVEMQPMEESGSGGSPEIAQEGAVSEEFGDGNEASTGLVDTQFVPTMTSNASYIVMPTVTLASSQTSQPTTGSLAVQPTEAAVVEESMETMSMVAESTEDVSVMSAPVVAGETDDYSYDAANSDIVIAAPAPLSLTEQLRALAYSVYNRILDMSQR